MEFIEKVESGMRRLPRGEFLYFQPSRYDIIYQKPLLMNLC